MKGLNAYISLRGDEGVKRIHYPAVMKGLNTYISLPGDEGVKRIH